MDRVSKNVRPRTAAWVALFVAALGVRVGFCVFRGTFGQTSTDRYREYIVAGQRLLEHGTLMSPLIVSDVDLRPSSLLPPVYSGIVAGVYAMLGVETYAATVVLHLLNALATSGAVAAAAWVALELGGRRAWAAAGAATALNPTLFGYTDLIWDTSVFTLGVTVTVVGCHYIGTFRPFRGAWFCLGVWLGALALLNPALTAAYPALVLWAVLRRGGAGLRGAVRTVCVVVLGWVVALLPWTVRNSVSVGEWAYVRGGFPIELWLGVCPEADAAGAMVYKNQFPLNNADIQRHISEIGERAFIDECHNKALLAIADDPARFVRLIGWRFMDYWAGTTFGHGGLESGGRSMVKYFLMVETGGLVMLMLVLRGRVGSDVGWLVAAMLLFSVVYCVTHVQVRFRAPVEPLAGVVLGVLLERVTSGRGIGSTRLPS